ncbi:MAG: sulfotransferase [Anaerolineales bacterium]
MPPINVFAFNALHNWRRVLRANPPVTAKYRAKLARFLVTSVLSEPLRAYEQRKYARVLQQGEIHSEPVFIMGPARSGTSHLHNLLALDPNLGYVSTLQGIAPGFVISSGAWLRRLIQVMLPPTRPMDNVTVSLDAPQEEEVAMANTSPHTFLHHLLFPQRSRDYFEAYYVFRDIMPQMMAEWREDYLRVLQVATYLSGGRPLVLKSPINNGRAMHLLRLFPNARFINLRRDPLNIMLSTRHMYRQILPPHQLQDISWEEVDENNLFFLSESMEIWAREQQRIPDSQIVNLRYEDLTANPLRELQRVYEALGLSTAQVLPRWQNYLAGLQAYRTNRFTPSPEDIAQARDRFGFLYESWGYPLPTMPNS